MQIHQNRMTGIRASQKGKVLIGILYRTCGSGFILRWFQLREVSTGMTEYSFIGCISFSFDLVAKVTKIHIFRSFEE